MRSGNETVYWACPAAACTRCSGAGSLKIPESLIQNRNGGSATRLFASTGQPGELDSAKRGKRTREDTNSSSKRRALASLSNQLDTVQERRQKIKEPFASFQPQLLCNSTANFAGVQEIGRNPASLCSSYCALDTPGSYGSPMVLSSPPSLACSELLDINHEEEEEGLCRDYAKDIFTYLMEAEARYQPKVCYMSQQPDLTLSMRAVLVDWLVEVTDEFSLHPDTMFMAVGIVDRFLSCASVLRGRLQLVGTTAMYIAAKMEEIYPPELADFAYITDDTYSKQQIVRMERLILQTLDYHLIAPSSSTFLHRYLRAAEGDMAGSRPSELSGTVTNLSKYLCELALLYSDPFLKYLPSMVAASAVCLARHTLKQVAWPNSLHRYSGYTVHDIGHCLQDLHRSFALASQQPQQAVRLKYCSEKFAKVATLAVPETLPV